MSKSINISFCKFKDSLLQTATTTIELVGWTPPLQKWTKLNFDISHSLSKVVAAVVVRDNEGNILTIVSSLLPPICPLLAESLVSSLAIDVASSLNLKFIFLERDSIVPLKNIQAQQETSP
ncbi:hypothetical protein PanWU01x14_164830 [Parasponia andersonii]|uniref:RNase H type-1 domain-containing protein n=1 Tax=Parasponia andersonii TaxID=3476 RepID=A0A2P5CCK0_PARAD|nr:hypothetical protein PanWU01x14_164830 [Parasponia andersonii]